MDKYFIPVICLVVVLMTTMVVTIFNHNLPNWCANPSGTGNSIIHPLCK